MTTGLTLSRRYLFHSIEIEPLLTASGSTIARNCDASFEEMAEWNDLDGI
mgnify:FL=1